MFIFLCMRCLLTLLTRHDGKGRKADEDGGNRRHCEGPADSRPGRRSRTAAGAARPDAALLAVLAAITTRTTGVALSGVINHLALAIELKVAAFQQHGLDQGACALHP